MCRNDWMWELILVDSCRRYEHASWSWGDDQEQLQEFWRCQSMERRHWQHPSLTVQLTNSDDDAVCCAVEKRRALLLNLSGFITSPFCKNQVCTAERQFWKLMAASSRKHNVTVRRSSVCVSVSSSVCLSCRRLVNVSWQAYISVRILREWTYLFRSSKQKLINERMTHYSLITCAFKGSVVTFVAFRTLRWTLWRRRRVLCHHTQASYVSRLQ